ncbi:MAG: hypothetical protein ACK5NY_04475 [Burkholderiaceae bacterium]
MPNARILLTIVAVFCLNGCSTVASTAGAAVSVAGAVTSTAVSVAGTAISLTGKAVGAVIDTATP